MPPGCRLIAPVLPPSPSPQVALGILRRMGCSSIVTAEDGEVALEALHVRFCGLSAPILGSVLAHMHLWFVSTHVGQCVGSGSPACAFKQEACGLNHYSLL